MISFEKKPIQTTSHKTDFKRNDGQINEFSVFRTYMFQNACVFWRRFFFLSFMIIALFLVRVFILESSNLNHLMAIYVCQFSDRTICRCEE